MKKEIKIRHNNKHFASGQRKIVVTRNLNYRKNFPEQEKVECFLTAKLHTLRRIQYLLLCFIVQLYVRQIQSLYLS